MAQPTRKEIVDAIVAAATPNICRFMGDTRAGKAPPITLENFSIEAFRYGAKALRARLSKLPRAKLDRELEASDAYLKKIPTLEEIARLNHENEARELSKRQAELGRRPRLQPAILDAARHYRGLNKTAKAAWDAIKERPYLIRNGNRVIIESAKTNKTHARARTNEKMQVRLSSGKQPRAAIGFDQWRQTYWPAAAVQSLPG